MNYGFILFTAGPLSRQSDPPNIAVTERLLPPGPKLCTVKTTVKTEDVTAILSTIE